MSSLVAFLDCVYPLWSVVVEPHEYLHPKFDLNLLMLAESAK